MKEHGSEDLFTLRKDLPIWERAFTSPLEPYNGATAIEELENSIRCTILSASDPYAVAGVTKAFGNRPDLVTGLATGTQAGIELVEKLPGIEALNVLDRDSHLRLAAILEDRLELEDST